MIKYHGKHGIQSRAHAKNITTGPYEIQDLYRFSWIFEESKATQSDVPSTTAALQTLKPNIKYNAMQPISSRESRIAGTGFIGATPFLGDRSVV